MSANGKKITGKAECKDTIYVCVYLNATLTLACDKQESIDLGKTMIFERATDTIDKGWIYSISNHNNQSVDRHITCSPNTVGHTTWILLYIFYNYSGKRVFMIHVLYCDANIQLF